jgi:hypothetical protein
MNYKQFDDVEILRNSIVTGFLTIHKMAGILDHARVALRRPCEVGDGNMERSLQENVNSSLQ